MRPLLLGGNISKGAVGWAQTITSLLSALTTTPAACKEVQIYNTFLINVKTGAYI